MTSPNTYLVEAMARAIWEERRDAAKRDHGFDLEEWGDGSIPFANGVRAEALAALKAMRAEAVTSEQYNWIAAALQEHEASK